MAVSGRFATNRFAASRYKSIRYTSKIDSLQMLIRFAAISKKIS